MPRGLLLFLMGESYYNPYQRPFYDTNDDIRYDFNGRILKVHYDRFCAQSPLPPQNLSALQHSLNSTPVQPATSSTQATLLQAAQLRQLVKGESHGGLSNLRSTSQSALQTLGSGASSSATSALAALHEQFASTGVIGLNSGCEQRENSSGSSPVSPFASSAIGLNASASLAERRQNKQATQVPAPIGTGSGSVSAASSRPGTSAGGVLASAPGSSSVGGTSVDEEGVGFEKSAMLGVLGRAKTSGPAALIQESSIAPVMPTRPANSMPASSMAIPKTAEVKSSSEPAMTALNPSSKAPNQSSSSSTSPRTSHPAHPGPHLPPSSSPHRPLPTLLSPSRPPPAPNVSNSRAPNFALRLPGRVWHEPRSGLAARLLAGTYADART